MSDINVGDIIVFTSLYDDLTSNFEVVSLAEDESKTWGRPMVYVRGCQGESHLGLFFGERSCYSDYWSVISKDAT